MGLANVKVMIPFCRTVDEGKRVIEAMAANGLKQGEDGLEVYAMCELPSNVVSADEFLKVFDGYSIGSNDLTQLVLGLDRDSGTVAHLFDERNAAVRQMIASAIEAAHAPASRLAYAARRRPITRTSPRGWSGRGSTRSRSTRTRPSRPPS